MSRLIVAITTVTTNIPAFFERLVKFLYYKPVSIQYVPYLLFLSLSICKWSLPCSTVFRELVGFFFFLAYAGTPLRKAYLVELGGAFLFLY